MLILGFDSPNDVLNDFLKRRLFVSDRLVFTDFETVFEKWFAAFGVWES